MVVISSNNSGGTTVKYRPDKYVGAIFYKKFFKGARHMKKLTVSDVTLKAVKEQDLSLTFKEKLFIAELLDSAGIDALELPSLINSKENEIIYRTICSSVKNSTVKIAVGDNLESLKVAYDCAKTANKFCLQVVMPVSTALMEYKFHLKASAMQAKIIELISEAKKLCDCVEFVAEDAFRAEEGFVVELAKSAYNAGACSITVCDDNGDALPEDYAKIVKDIKDACDIEVFVQPSNKLFMGASSCVEAIKAGAEGLKVSVYGLSVISDILRAKKFNLGVESNIDFTNVKTISKTVIDMLSGKVVDAESKINVVNGVVDEQATIKDVAEFSRQLGYELSDEDIGKVFEEVKKLTATKNSIDTAELETVIASTAMQVPSTYHLVNYVVNSGNSIPATANIILEKKGEKFTGVSTGDGPIDAAFNAIEQIIGHHYELDDFQVHAATKGKSAVGKSIIRLRADGKLYPGNGASTDIIGACIRAYINALNKIVYGED